MCLTNYLLGASLVLAAISAAQSTTEVQVFAAGTSQVPLTSMQGSIINVDATATTYMMTCAPNITPACVLLHPVTFTEGPSTFDQNIAYSTQSDGIDVEVTLSQTCTITASTQGASCSLSVGEYVSADGQSTSTSTTTITAVPSSEIYYDTLTVTGGVEKLNSPTATSTPTGAAVMNKRVGGAIAAVGLAALAMA